jgi:hypothetical protein
MTRIRISALLLLLPGFLYSCVRESKYPELNISINELMPVNINTVTDQNGEFDDWIELYNRSAKPVDLTGFYLTDNKNIRNKWKFPSGTEISGNAFLIIWADGDTLQNGLHTNFKLSSAGEKLLFLNPEMLIIDEVRYPAQTLALTYSRKPDGTGSFIWQQPTFNASNGTK